jgi:hypothetical protein
MTINISFKLYLPRIGLKNVHGQFVWWNKTALCSYKSSYLKQSWGESFSLFLLYLFWTIKHCNAYIWLNGRGIFKYCHYNNYYLIVLKCCIIVPFGSVFIFKNNESICDRVLKGAWTRLFILVWVIYMYTTTHDNVHDYYWQWLYSAPILFFFQ